MTDIALLPCPFCGGKAAMHGAIYMSRKFPACTQCGAERGTPEQWNSRHPGPVEIGGPYQCDQCGDAALRLARLTEAEHNDAETLRAEVSRLRKIAAHVPAKVYIAAKERAGYGMEVKTAESGAWKNLRCDVCGSTFDGFHKLNAAGDRCCPRCAERPTR